MSIDHPDRGSLRSRPLAAVGISVAVTVGVLLAAEIAVRLAGVEPPEWPTAEARPPLRFVEVDPLLGPLPRPGWSGEWIGNFTVSIDERGFRSTGAPRPAAPAARVAFLGDSCSFGWGIDTPDTFVALLEADALAAGESPIEPLNAAFAGLTAVTGRYLLRERVLPHHPDVVVLGFSGNNAFRLSLAADADRFRLYGLRKVLLHSRLFHWVAATLARRAATGVHPRDRKAVINTPLESIRRVAAPAEFTAAIRTMVMAARAAGARVLFLIFPRAATVSREFGFEDAAVAARARPPSRSAAGEAPSADELMLLESSCLDHRALDDPIATMYARLPEWRPVFPADEALAALLQAGARAYVAGDLAAAARRFETVRARQPDQPLAAYDLGVVQLAAGDEAAGLRHLAEADRLACNVFLQYQVILWTLAVALDVPVVDLTLFFQAHLGEKLFMDPAHPNAAGQRVIADALRPTIRRLSQLTVREGAG